MATSLNKDFSDLVPLLASSLKLKHNGKQLKIMEPVGNGFCWTEKIPCGISVMVSDSTLNQPCNLSLPETNDQYYTLQFNEELPVESGNQLKNKKQTDYHSWVKISHSSEPEELFFPSSVRLRSVKIFFSKDHLASILSKELIDQLTTRLFPEQLAEKNFAPIATEYRILLDELLTEEIHQPLRLTFIQNRIFLLIENYLLKISAPKATNGNKNKRFEDEAVRLMKVEALLVKNFAEPPPTIDELSRISAMSPTKLKNDFKRQYGMPIYEYYQKNRMLKAKNLLLLGKYSIKEVGIMVGYSNLSHFSNTFKKEFGHLPSELSSKDGVLIDDI